MREMIRALTAPAWGLLALLLALIVLLAWCSWDGQRDRRKAEADRRADITTLERDRDAREAAADQRLEDTVSIAHREKERADATAPLPDNRPSARRLARACVQLRQQGTREADLPAVCRPAR